MRLNILNRSHNDSSIKTRANNQHRSLNLMCRLRCHDISLDMIKSESVLPKITANQQHLQTPPLANFWLKQHDHLSEIPAAEHEELKNINSSPSNTCRTSRFRKPNKSISQQQFKQINN